MLKLSISNIAWPKEADEEMYGHLMRMGYSGLEIAPSRLFGDEPYTRIREAAQWARDLKRAYGLNVPSMQSIWYGRTENMFKSSREAEALLAYSQSAVEFAGAVGCKNLVFGCPRNRNMETPSEACLKEAETFFTRLGAMAAEQDTCFGIEANPEIYHTNYLNTTPDAVSLLSQLDVPGLGLNLDVGTMIYNKEAIENIRPWLPWISHVHISEPGLAKIERRALHISLLRELAKAGYSGYVSVEMAKCGSLQEVLEVMSYIKEVAADAES